jgi:hypothetical protein
MELCKIRREENINVSMAASKANLRSKKLLSLVPKRISRQVHNKKSIDVKHQRASKQEMQQMKMN